MNVKYEWNAWNQIDGQVVEITVFKLQKRIYKASQRGYVKLVLYCSMGYHTALGVMVLQILGYNNVRGFPPSIEG